MAILVFEIIFFILLLTTVIMGYIYLNRMRKDIQKILAFEEGFNNEIDLSEILHESPDLSDSDDIEPFNA